jgi:hypothetical protein
MLCLKILKVAEKGLEETLQAGTGAALFCYVGASVAGAEIMRLRLHNTGRSSNTMRLWF